MDDRGPTAAPSHERATVPDDRPVRAEQPALRRPALWSLALGAASLVPLSVGAFQRADERLVTVGTPASNTTFDLATALFLAAGCLACVWLVRLQWLLARADRLRTMATDVGLWLMWVIPFVMWALPAARISHWDKRIHGRRSLTVLAWAVLWIPCSAFILGSSRQRAEALDPAGAWLHVAVFVTTYAVWAATVVRLTRGAEVVAHETGVEA